MSELDLNAITERYHRALNAKPGKGPISEAGIAAITDSVCDVPELLTALADQQMIAQPTLVPAERIALTIAKAQVARGDEVTPNIAAVCVTALARIAADHG